MELAMLSQLLLSKQITEKEYQTVKMELMKTYRVQSDLTIKVA